MRIELNGQDVTTEAATEGFVEDGTRSLWAHKPNFRLDNKLMVSGRGGGHGWRPMRRARYY